MSLKEELCVAEHAFLSMANQMKALVSDTEEREIRLAYVRVLSAAKYELGFVRGLRKGEFGEGAEGEAE